MKKSKTDDDSGWVLIEGPREAGGSDAAFHNAILDNPEADKMIAIASVKQAMAMGIPREMAERLYMPV